MKTKVFCGFGLILMLVIFCCSTKINSSKPSYIPKDGFVPNQETAIKIAEAIWLPVYGDKIYEEKPFVAKLKGGVWIVEGTIKTENGGAVYIEIQKKDCRILEMYHGK